VIPRGLLGFNVFDDRTNLPSFVTFKPFPSLELESSAIGVLSGVSTFLAAQSKRLEALEPELELELDAIDAVDPVTNFGFAGGVSDSLFLLERRRGSSSSSLGGFFVRGMRICVLDSVR
jgi:hypothetical protein